MNYNKLIKTVSAIVEDDNIEKKGLLLEYRLLSAQHSELQEYFHEMFKTEDTKVELKDVFEVEVGGLVVRFIKKG